MTLVRRNVWLRQRRLLRFGFMRTDRILDLGCGDGLDIEILRHMGCARVVGVDISPKLLAEARKRNPDVRFVQAPIEALPFQNASFDKVVVDSVFPHVEDFAKALREIRRVLAPHGKFCFIEAHNSMWRKLLNWATFSPIGLIIPYLHKRRRASLVEKKTIDYWNVAEKEFLQTIQVVGFEKIFVKVDLLSIIGLYQKM